MSYDTILFSVDGGIARLTLNRPDKLNSFNTQMHGEVRDALARLPGSDARVLILTGAGRGFGGGALNQIVDRGAGDAQKIGGDAADERARQRGGEQLARLTRRRLTVRERNGEAVRHERARSRCP